MANWVSPPPPQPTMAECQRCCQDEGVPWNTWSKSDRKEGLCPKETERKVYFCENTGQPLKPFGRVKITM